MQNNRSPDVAKSLDGLLANQDSNLAAKALEGSSSLEQPAQAVSREPARESPYVVLEQKQKLDTRLRLLFFAVVALLLLGGGTFAFLQRGNRDSRLQSGSFGAVHIPLGSFTASESSTDSTQTLKVNGRLQVGNSIVLTPSSQPTNAARGQLYFDQSSNRLTYYDGSQFVSLQGGVSTQVTNITGGTGGLTGNGVQGSIAMFTGSNVLGSSLLNQSGLTVNIASSSSSGNGQAVIIGNNGGSANTVNIDAGSGTGAIQLGNSAANHGIQIGTGAGVQTVALGSGSSNSATTIQGGTGNLSLATGATSGTSGSISIKTGDSSTTASGNITIDTGSGMVSGEMIENKTFEGGLDDMTAWFGNTVAQSTAQARSGIYSLAETGTAANWGIIETLPGTNVTSGHQYYFSVWVRAATTPRSIIGSMAWVGSAGTVSLTPITDSTTGWTEMTGLAIAPAGATSVYFRAQGIGVVGEVHYFDDMSITDLSSSSAISALSIGSSNAKIVTIGNINQIGATSIFGGSGININGGAGSITLSGGVVNITGNAASTFNTTSGALTLTSAATATWGVSTASSGVGGDLTVRAGNGGTDGANDGGDLVLQGGNANGAGIDGSVIVRPQTDSVDIFQIQNSTGTPLLMADSSGMKITIVGTTANFATLTLANAHFGSTQTTAPAIGTPINCGTTPTAAIVSGSTDSAGSFTVTTGTGGTSSICDTVVTFNKAYGATPKSILVVGKTDAASAARQVYVSSATSTTFTTSFATSAGGANSTTYSFSYWVIE